MSKKFFKVKNGLHVKPSDPSTITDPEVGDIIVDSQDDNKVKVYQDGEFSTISGSGGTVANFFADFDKLTPTVSNASVADDAVTFLPIDDNKKSKKATFSAAGSVLYEVAASADLEGAQGLMTIWIKTDVQGVTVSTTTDGVKQSTLSVLATGKWKQYEIPYVVGGTNQGLIVESANAGDVNIDEPFVGLAPAGYIQDVGQAQFVGSLVFSESDCAWQTQRTDLGSFSADSDCVATQITGNVAAPDTFIPAIKILNPRTDGYYKVSNYAQFITTSGGSGNNTCEYALSQDGLTASYTMFAETSDSQWSGVTISNLNDSFRFTDTTDKTIQVIARVRNNGNNAVCRTYGNTDAGLASKWEVHFFPDASSTIVTQDTELTAKTANELTARIAENGSIISDNYDFLSNCSESSTSPYAITCNFSPNLFSVIPSCTASVLSGANVTVQHTAKIEQLSTSSIELRRNANDDVPSQVLGIELHCSKQGADVNKSATIVGKFENINSSDLVKVEASGNSGATYSGGQALDFIEVSDNKGWFSSNKTITPTYDTQLLFIGTVALNAIDNRAIYVRKDGSENVQMCTYEPNTTTFLSFKCLVNVVAGSTYTIVSNSTITLANSPSHTLSITELPDTESIVKNLLAESSQTKCQTKVLSGSVSNTGIVSDLTFNNLVIGKKYSMHFKHVANSSSTGVVDSLVAFEYNSGADIRLSRIALQTNSSLQNLTSYTKNFTASESTVQFNLLLSASSTLFANTANGTEATLCQLPDTVLDTEEF